MPTCLFPLLKASKKLSLLSILLCAPLIFFSQSLTGLWTGALSNDSNTIRKDQLFEIALTEYKGKVYGYSRSEFIVDDTLYYIVKRVKGSIAGDVCEVTDDDIIAYNFKGKIDKGVKVTSTFRRNKQDSTWYLEGTWKTNLTKKYYAITGKVGLAEEKDFSTSKLFPHLEELNIADEIAFYRERKETPAIARVIKPERIRTEYKSTKIDQPDNNSIAVTRPSFKEMDYSVTPIPDSDNIAAMELKRTEPTRIASSSINISGSKPANMEDYAVISRDNVAALPVEKQKPTSIPVPNATVKGNRPTGFDEVVVIGKDGIQPIQADKEKSTTFNKTAVATTAKPTAQKPITAPQTVTATQTIASQTKVGNDTKTVNNKPVATTSPAKTPTISNANEPSNKNNTLATNGSNNTLPNKEQTTAIASLIDNRPPVAERPVDIITAPVKTVAGRTTDFRQVVNFSADSIELALYDNGEIDGDTVSVYLNGEVILAKQGLKSSAIKKMIHIPPGQSDFTIVLFAENLGKYPPNTGLLVVHDGNDTYNLRFSSDLQKNSGIVFKRKPPR